MGMVAHWKRAGGAHARHSLVINGLGAIATAITVFIVIVSKFVEGAWITLVAIPGILLLMWAVHRHYDHASRELASQHPLPTADLHPPIVVVPLEGWSKVTQKALRFALTLSPHILAVQVSTSDEPQDLEKRWGKLVENPMREAGLPVPALKVIHSPYRAVIHPTARYIHKLEREHPDRQIAVVIPQLIEKHWYEYFLHRSEANCWLRCFCLRTSRESPSSTCRGI